MTCSRTTSGLSQSLLDTAGEGDTSVTPAQVSPVTAGDPGDPGR